MHRIYFRLTLLALLYSIAGCGSTTHQPAIQQPAGQQATQAPPQAASAPVAVEPPAPVITEPELAANAEPHIALLLPLKNVKLEQASGAIQQGFVAASTQQRGGLPIRVYACADEEKEIAELYQQAVRMGAKAVVGPITPAGVKALAAKRLPVPTLALNRADVKVADNLYLFGLVLENEARQAARVASTADFHTASIISADDPLSRRLTAAFTDEWKKMGGKVRQTIIYKGDNDVLEGIPVDIGNMVFVASSPETARKFRPFINAMLPVYGTSQLFVGNGGTLINYDLREVVFIDMPWMLQQDSARILRYPHANPPLPDANQERLYAMGVDAYRLIRLFTENRTQGAFPFDGVTGTIRLNTGHQLDREGILGEFKDGMGLTPEGVTQLRAKKKASGAFPMPGDAPR